jgi:uncharacterized protein (TIGR02453 family)
MSVVEKTEYRGFSRETLAFLKKLERNNERRWFEAHRADYERHVLAPMRDLVERLAPAILAIDPYLDVRPAVDKTISRIHRDTRFSANKAPYRTTLWIAFKRPGRDWKRDPTFFMEFSPKSYRYGMGFYEAGKQTMENLRAFIDNHPRQFLEAVDFITSGGWELGGEKYKRILDPSKEGAILDWYQRRNCYVLKTKEIDNLFLSDELSDELTNEFQQMQPLYEILWSAVG